jgi:diazepam-binding inhibitor (GABA receptor modulator, acyl-CoA-binding protein)
MTIDERFEDAQKRVRTLSKPPSNDRLLELYALFKQGSSGDVAGSRPGMLDLKGRAKYDAWASKKGVSRQAAMEAYVALVDELVSGAPG